MHPVSQRRLIWLVGLLLLAVVGGWLGSVLIRRAYEGTAPQAINDLISGQSEHSVNYYVNSWWRLVVTGVALLLLFGIAIELSVRHRGALSAGLARAASRLPDHTTSDLLWLAVAFGMLGGFAEALRWIVEYSVLHRVTAQAVTGDLLWKIPVAASVSLTVLVLLIAGVARLLPKPTAAMLRGTCVILLVWIAVYSFISSIEIGIHWFARILLAAGIALVVHRRAGGNPRAIVRFGVRTSVVAAVVLIITATSLYIGRRQDFRASVRSTALTGKKSPNIIFIIWDTVRAASLGLYDYDKPTTPNLDALGADGVVFERAIAPAPWTLPSHASVFTGLYHHQHSASRTSALNGVPPTLAEVLANYGYQTAGFVANTYWLGSGFGLNRGFRWYDDRPPTSVASVMKSWWATKDVLTPLFARLGWGASERISAARINSALLKWIDEQENGTPFFAFLNWFDAHEPYVPPDNFGYPFSDNTPLSTWSWLSDRRYSPGELTELREAYDACIKYLDHQLGVLVGQLEKRGLRDNTIIIVTSDHGETIGEQDPRLLGHENNVYYNVLHVPLVIYWKRSLESRRVSEVVSLVDLPATIVDLSRARGQAAIAGHSLRPLMTGEQRSGAQVSPALSQGDPADYHLKSRVWPMAKGPLYSLVLENHHYMINARGEEFVYDYLSDPWERAAMTNSPAAQAALPHLRSLISSTRRQAK